MTPIDGPSPPNAGAGWYSDPGGSGTWRYWDGARWTDALSSAIPPASPSNASDDSNSWAVAAHLSALASLFIGLPVVGPLVVFLAKSDDPYVRRHAAEALNFNISVMIYGVVLGVGFFVGLFFFLAGLLLLPLIILLGFLWLVFVCVATTKAGDGVEYRYPLTIRFVR